MNHFGRHRSRLHSTAICVISVMVLFPCLAAAQIKIHETIGVEDGLVQSQVTSILEDRHGFIWFGTFGGVSRWDGVDFTHLRSHDGLRSQDIRALYEEDNGAIFIGTNGGGLSIYRDGELVSIGPEEGLSHHTVRAICGAPDGSILLGTDLGVDVFRDGRIDTLSVDPQLRGIMITDLDTGPDGTIYAASVENGVIIAGADSTVVLNAESGLPVNLTRAVHLARDGTLYLSVARNGIWTYRQGILARLTEDPEYTSDYIKDIYEDRQGNLYFGTFSHGVRIFRDGVPEAIDEASGLANSRVWAIHEDRNGLIYLGTWGGVCLYRGDRLITFDLDPELTPEIVTAIHQTPDGAVYFGVVGAQLFRYQDDLITELDLGSPPLTNNIWSIFESRDGQLYLGAEHTVLVKQDNTFVALDDPEQKLRNAVYTMHESAAGELFFGTYDGLFVRDGQQIRLFDSEDDYRRNVIYDIEETGDGTIYLATRGGVSLVGEDTVTPWNEIDMLSDIHIWTIHALADGTLCIGTNSLGLVLWQNGQTRVFDATNGLTDNTVYGILEDADGRLYLTTNRGVNILDLSAAEPEIRHLHHRDGLPSEEGVQGAHCLENTGQLWFGTIRGACRYDPGEDRPAIEPPPVHLTRIRIFEDEIPLSEFEQAPRLHYKDNYIKINYVGIHPAAPEKVLYRYRLSNVDRDWVQTDQSFVQYTNLDGGNYSFELTAGNEWGVWSDPIELSFTILPPFWKTWWFVLLIAVLIGGAISLVVFYRVRHLLAIERIRRQIAADLHDDVGSGLSSISILCAVIEQKIQKPASETISQELGQIGHISRELIASTSDLVWLANPKQDSLFDLISRLGATYEDLLHTTGASFEVCNLEEFKGLRLDLKYRQHLFLIFKEAINNALKYSQAKTVRLEIERRGHKVQMLLSDDGRGFDCDTVEQGNGLTNMKNRAQALGGSLELRSRVGKGTTVEFRGSLG